MENGNPTKLSLKMALGARNIYGRTRTLLSLFQYLFNPKITHLPCLVLVECRLALMQCHYIAFLRIKNITKIEKSTKNQGKEMSMKCKLNNRIVC